MTRPSALESLKRLPTWPGRMIAPIAALYLDITETELLARFRDVAVMEGRTLLWARAQLDRYIPDQFDVIDLERRPPRASRAKK